MLNTLLDAMTAQLHSTFGDGYKYYVEDVEQNLTKPCFTIDAVLPLMRSTSTIRYERIMPMVVHYFTDDVTELKKSSYAKAEEIVECLEYVPFLNTTLRGEDISWQITDDVLQIFITYRFDTNKVVEIETDMETVGHSTGVSSD